MKNILEPNQVAITGLRDGALDPDNFPDGAQVSAVFDELKPFDVIELNWTVPSPDATFFDSQVIQAHHALPSFIIPYPVLDAARGCEATLQLTSLRNGVAYQSLTRTVVIHRNILWPPEIPESVNGKLDLNVVTGDATAYVAPYTRMAVGQTFWLRMHGFRADGAAWSKRLEGPVTVQPGELDTGIRRSLQRSDLLQLKNDSVLRLEMKAGWFGDSEQDATLFPESSWMLTQRFLTLAPPSVTGQIDGILLAGAIPPQGVTVTVPAYGGMEANQWVKVLWTGSNRSYTTAAQIVTTVGPMTFTVPREVAVANVGGVISVTYTVSPTADGPEQSSTPLPFQIPPLVDTSTLELNGLAVRSIENWPRNGSEFDNNWTQRQGRGGTPPYQYVSSAPGVASATNEGKVVGLRNGQATITVTDSTGITSSYQITVSNVWTVLFSSTELDANQAVTWAAAQGAQVLSHTAIMKMFSYYAYPLPAPYHSRSHWISDSPGGCGGPDSTAVWLAGEAGIRTCHGNAVRYHNGAMRQTN